MQWRLTENSVVSSSLLFSGVCLNPVLLMKPVQLTLVGNHAKFGSVCPSQFLLPCFSGGGIHCVDSEMLLGLRKILNRKMRSTIHSKTAFVGGQSPFCRMDSSGVFWSISYTSYYDHREPEQPALVGSCRQSISDG